MTHNLNLWQSHGQARSAEFGHEHLQNLYRLTDMCTRHNLIVTMNVYLRSASKVSSLCCWRCRKLCSRCFRRCTNDFRLLSFTVQWRGLLSALMSCERSFAWCLQETQYVYGQSVTDVSTKSTLYPGLAKLNDANAFLLRAADMHSA